MNPRNDQPQIADADTSPAIAPALGRIVAYIADHRHRDRFDPTELSPQLLPHLFILAIEPGEAGLPRLRIRLTGTALDAAFGRRLQGHCLEEFLHGPHSAAVLDGFRHCATARRDVWMRQVVTIANRAPRFVEGVACYVEPELIYGGLMFGEMSIRTAAASFERKLL